MEQTISLTKDYDAYAFGDDKLRPFKVIANDQFEYAPNA
jgi:hypothetical protein